MLYRMSRLGLNLAGVYRKLITYPKNLSWKMMSSPPLPPPPKPLPGGLKLGSTPTPGTVVPQEEDGVSAVENSALDEEEQTLEMCFDLDSATYATMLVREITKNIY